MYIAIKQTATGISKDEVYFTDDLEKFNAFIDQQVAEGGYWKSYEGKEIEGMSKKNKDGVFSLLRQILAEQKKQTKILQAIESSKEHLKNDCSWSRDGRLKVK